MFVSSDEVFSWLSKFINLERGQIVRSFRLDRMEFLAELAGNPERWAPSIHIAGSKGKGSVTGMSAAILAAAGYRVARYMSPHVIDIRERICLNDSYFSEAVYCAAGNELREIAEVRLPAAANELFDPETEDGCEPTYFELLTLLFFLCAKHANCNVMVVETGMGGRLDSTNVLDPLVSVITLIEIEHSRFLGNTITEIAGEKAGIIKQGKPVVLANQSEEALEVFRKKAEEKNSKLIYMPDTVKISDLKINPNGTEWRQTPFSTQFFIPIPGQIQAENAALAVLAVKTAFPQITGETIRQGLANVFVPGRFEKISETPPFIIDGAHTPKSLELCVKTFCSLYGEGGILLFGCAADKDAAAMAEVAHSHFSRIIITTPGTFKISNPVQVFEAFVLLAGRNKTILVPDTNEAIRFAELLRHKEGNKLPVLGTGSFYLVSEIRKSMCDTKL